MQGTPAARAVSRSVTVSPTSNAWAGSPPARSTEARNGAASGLRTGNVSAPTSDPKTPRTPRRSSNTRASASGLLVQTATQPRVHVDHVTVNPQKPGIVIVDPVLHIRTTDPAIAQPQHRSSARECGQRIPDRVQQVAVSICAEHRIGRGDQVTRRIGQRPVQIEYHRAHLRPRPLLALPLVRT